jgi:Putative MetA-pathway of phenol degradation
MLCKSPGKPSRIGVDADGNPRVSCRMKKAFTRAIIIPIGFGTAWISAPLPAIAGPSGGDDKQVSADSQNTADQSDNTNNGTDLTRPQNAFEMRFSDETSSTDTTKTNRARMLLLATAKISLNADWRLSWLAQAPLLDKTTTTFDTSSVDREFGLGDATFQTILSHTLTERWAVGVIARLVTPTADDGLGSGKWQIVPGFGVRYSLPEYGADSFFAPSMRWAISFAGDPKRREIRRPRRRLPAASVTRRRASICTGSSIGSLGWSVRAAESSQPWSSKSRVKPSPPQIAWEHGTANPRKFARKWAS